MYSACQQKHQSLKSATDHLQRKSRLAHSWWMDRIGPLSMAPGGHPWVLTGYFTFRFTYAETEANSSNIIRDLEQKVF